MNKTTASLLITSILALTNHSYAGSATWKPNPISGDWNTVSNWNPAVIPNGPNDVASFAFTNQPEITLTANTEVSSIVYNTGATSYNTTVPADHTLTIGIGITNSSGTRQNFVIDQGTVVINGGSGGQLTDYVLKGTGSALFFTSGGLGTGTYTIEGGAQIVLSNFASAGFGTTCTFTGNGDGSAGLLQFSDNSSTHNVIYNLNGDGAGANVTLLDQSHSFADTFNVNGADSVDHLPGVLTFAQAVGGSESTNVITANAGTNGGAGGRIVYQASAGSFESNVFVYGNGSLDISGDVNPVNLASLQGDGLVFLGHNILLCVNEFADVFAGTIQGDGLLIKKDRGVLTLSGANTYTGSTTITQESVTRIGTLQVTNTTGSATGTGPVMVSYGTLGGSGIIKGVVTVGNGSTGINGFLAPAAGGKKAATLTIQSALTFKVDSAYNWLIQAKGRKARTDRVNARGVTIESGAQFTVLADQVQSSLRLGSTFTVISNTAITPIAGTFNNLPDGSTLLVNGNNLQANYSGGDGNDLTLTVVP